MHVMTLEEWKERTYISKIHVRSDKMRAIDNALKRFHQTQAVSDLSSIRQAIDAWKRSHENWESSKRNRDSVMWMIRAIAAKMRNDTGNPYRVPNPR